MVAIVISGFWLNAEEQFSKDRLIIWIDDAIAVILGARVKDLPVTLVLFAPSCVSGPVRTNQLVSSIRAVCMIDERSSSQPARPNQFLRDTDAIVAMLHQCRLFASQIASPQSNGVVGTASGFT